MIRDATLTDVPALVALENRCFESDRLSERSFRHLLTKGHAALLVDAEGERLRAYVLVLFHRNTSMARLYSFAVDPPFRGRGLAKALVSEAERVALTHGVVSMRLEVRADNAAAQGLYQSLGYRTFATAPDYYEDHMEALRMEKALAPHLAPHSTPVPFYAQTLEFTCGPASLMMAMQALDPALTPDRMLELRLWREATTIFMTSGHGGCGPFGLALSAYHRGFDVALYARYDIDMFTDSVRSAEKREVIRTVHEDFMREVEAAPGIAVHERPITLAEAEAAFRNGAIPVVLISSYRLTGDKSPHWVVIAGFDARFVYVNEPYVDREDGQTETTCIGIPIPRDEFERMTRYGRSRQYATLLISRRRNP
jgi:ribosomal protein S18 acetylase RimI-like enzyme